MSRPTINAVWIGPHLGPIRAACLRSFIRHGYRTVLYVYERPDDIPAKIEVADANEILPNSRIVRYSKGGSVALFTNLFRYELLRRSLGVYVDCDVYCMGVIEDAPYIFGWESENSINNAILKLPADSRILNELCDIKDKRAFVPLWASKKSQFYYRLRAAIGAPVGLADMPWGTTGPRALTWYSRKYGLFSYAAPIDRFYPVHFTQVQLLLDPELTLADITTRRTVFLHLYDKMLTAQLAGAEIPGSSPLGQIVAS